VNRIDELSPEQIEHLAQLLEEQFAGRPIVRMSAKTGEGFDAFCGFLDQQGNFGQRLMDVDYDVYAEGEAELGWLNCQIDLTSPDNFDLDEFLLSLLVTLKSDFAAVSAETAHHKTIGMSEGYYAVANLVSSESEPQLSLASGCQTTSANVVVNARVAIDPELLTEKVRSAIVEQAKNIGCVAAVKTLQSFRPGRPVPTHRIM
jgi:hypothetical protein